MDEAEETAAEWVRRAAEAGCSQWCVRCAKGWLRPEAKGLCGVCRKELAGSDQPLIVEEK